MNREPLRNIAADRGLVGGPFGSSLVNADYTDEGIPVIRGANMSAGRFIGGQFAFVSQEKFARDLSRNSAAPRDVIYTQRGTLGQVALVPSTGAGTFVVSQSQMRLRVDPQRAVPEFVYYASTTSDFLQQVDDRAISTGVPHTNLGILAELEIPLPSLSEQQAIAEVLGALDDKIAANTALAANTASVATAEYRSAIRDGGLELPIDEVSILLARGITPRYLPDGDGMRVLNQKCVRDQLVSLEPCRWTDDAKVKQEKLLAVGDVLVNSTGQGTLGRVARWTLSERATVDSHITIVRPDSDVSDPAVIGQAILAVEADIEALGKGSTGQTELSRVELGRARIRIPSRERAEGLGVKLRALSACQDAARAENDTLAATRDALLPQLMSGKLRVRDAEDLIVQAGV